MSGFCLAGEGEVVYHGGMTKLDELCAFLSIPSVSAEPQHAKDVENCADFLVSKLSAMGFSAKKHLTDIQSSW